MSMQSTGQGATHRSQPVHQSASTVCMRLLAPTMASTGRAWMQSVQPMQCASSCAPPAAGGLAARQVQRQDGLLQQHGQRGDAFIAAGRAAVDGELRRRRWRRRRAGAVMAAVHCVCGTARRCGRRAGTGHGDSVEKKGPRGPRGLTVRLEGGGDEDSASSGPRAIAAGAAPQADCRMNSAILGQIISRQRRRKSRSGRSSARCSAACGRPGCSCTA